jgi:hypothetical protein
VYPNFATVTKYALSTNYLFNRLWAAHVGTRRHTVAF